ncbi:MAG: ATP-dependent helicase [Alphaproteobacteria bacterium]
MYYNKPVKLNLENLNPEQLRAVQTTSGPVLVLAGAGTGKTRVLTTRVGYILDKNLAAPWQVLALTFTNKAANEMKSRIDAMADGAFFARDIWCGTFHSICLRILRTNYAAAGLRSDFLIYGDDDQKNVIKKVLNDLNITTTKKPSEYIEDFSRIKDRGLTTTPSVDRIFNAYNDELRRMSAVDFGDIILLVLKLFENFPDILARYQKQFKYILVDEFQDTNAAQMQLLKYLTRGDARPNICCVGDDDQSIYSWRGAEIKNILDFEKTFPGTVVIRLETNYRSTGNILGAANSLIRHNDDRLGKDLRTSATGDMGEKIYVFTLPTDLDEAKFITDAIAKNGPIYSDKTILIRSGSLSRLFEEEFARRGIPYRLIGATKFYDRMEIRDAIAYIRLLVHPFDDMSFLRAIGKPRRGFGPSAIEKMRAAGENLMAGLRATPFRGKQLDAANAFLSAFDFDWENMPPRDAAQKLLDASGYIKMWQESKDVDAPDRINNVSELINTVIAKYDSLQDFLEQAALMMTDDNDEPDALNQNVVNIMTIHAAKGLEFNNVFLPATEEGIFPNDKSIQEGAIAEERRLAYVAITRARKLVVITNAMSRVMYGERKYNAPSRFIDEIDSSFLSFGDSTPRPAPQTYAKREYKRKTVAAPRKTLVGRQARHAEYGTGVIIEEGTGILTIAFGARGIKKIARDFVTVL